MNIAVAALCLLAAVDGSGSGGAVKTYQRFSYQDEISSYQAPSYANRMMFFRVKPSDVEVVYPVPKKAMRNVGKRAARPHHQPGHDDTSDQSEKSDQFVPIQISLKRVMTTNDILAQIDRMFSDS